MDALPIAEQTGLPFASEAKAKWAGQEVGVAHVCGHDGHTAILMGVAEVLSAMKVQIPGTVKFIFQPAEEGAPPGEEGGASLMVKEGALKNPTPQAVFGLHLNSRTPLGRAGYRAGPFMASGDTLKIVVKGAQTHGALPWLGVEYARELERLLRDAQVLSIWEGTTNVPRHSSTHCQDSTVDRAKCRRQRRSHDYR